MTCMACMAVACELNRKFSLRNALAETIKRMKLGQM